MITPDFDDDEVRIDITPENNQSCKQGNIKKVLYFVFFVTVVLIVGFILFSIYIGESAERKDQMNGSSGGRAKDDQVDWSSTNTGSYSG